MSEKRPHRCGYCLVGDCHLCRGTTKWYDKEWICQCRHNVEVQGI